MKRFLAFPVLLALSLQTVSAASVRHEPLDFSHYDATGGFPQVMISAIFQDRENNIWIASKQENRVVRFDGSHIEQFPMDSPDAVYQDSKGRVMVSSPTLGQVMVIDGSITSIVKTGEGIPFAPQFFQPLPGDRLFCASGTKIAVLPSSVLPSDTTVPLDIPGRIRSCASIDGIVFFGTEEGHLMSFDVVKEDPVLIASFPSEVNAILSDGRNGIWVGTRRNGLYHCTSGGAVLGKLPLNGDASDSGKENILCLQYKSPGILWIGTTRGLAVYDETDSGITLYRHSSDDTNSLSHNTVRRIMKDNQGGMWLGTYYGGTNYWHPSRNRFRSLRPGNTEYDLNDHIVNAIREDDDGLIWIGTNSGGINCYDPQTGRIRKYPDPQSFNDVVSLYPCPGTHDILYYSNIGGLRRLDSRSGRVTRLCETPYANMILPAKEEGKLILWTIGGRCSLYSIADDSCVPAPEDEILSPLPEYALSEKDQYGCIWTGTGNGLVQKTGDDRIRTFHTFDALASEYFSKNAHCRAKDGKMYFGGIGGVTVFNPSDFAEDEDCPTPRLSSVVLDGVTPIPFKTGETLRLRQTKGHYFFHFSVPDFISEGKNTFTYKMEGYDKDWIDAGQDGYAVYSNLPKGTYTFKLQAFRRGDKDGGSGICELKVKILPPWYRTTAASLAGLFLLALTIMLTVLHLIHQKEMENKLAMHEMEAKHAREITRLKALRFINASAAGETVGNVKDLSREEELFITKVMSIVEANIDNPAFNSTMLADKMNVSRMTLHKQMKEMTGASTLDFIHKIRFTEACRLLKESDLTVSEIAYKLGFGHPTSFIASFKKYIGCTPLEFKQRQ